MLHSETISNDVLEVGIAEKKMKSWTIDGAFWRFFKRWSWSLSCWEKKWKKVREMVHSGAILNDVLEVGIAEKKMKSWTIYGAFWRCSWRLSSWEFKSNDATRCIPALIETMFWKFELLGQNWKRGGKMVHYDAIWNDVLEVGNAEKKLKARGWSGAC